MNTSEQQQICSLNDQLPQNVRLQWVKTPDSRSHLFEEFCVSLNQFAPKIQVVRETEDTARVPELRIHSRIRYQALPSGHHLPPFLDALLMTEGQKTPVISSELKTLLDQVSLPVALSLYIAEQCPFCPSVVQSLLPLAAASPLVEITVIDAGLFTEIAEKNHVLSVPTLILDDAFRWTGAIPIPEVLDAIIHRDPSRLQADTLMHMLADGNAGMVSEMMAARNMIFPALVELLIHPRWSVRLGAMVAIETLAAEKPVLASQLPDLLWPRFDIVDDKIKGDILYMIGEVDHGGSIEKLRVISEKNHDPEVLEAAEEALIKISLRSRP